VPKKQDPKDNDQPEMFDESNEEIPARSEDHSGEQDKSKESEKEESKPALPKEKGEVVPSDEDGEHAPTEAEGGGGKGGDTPTAVLLEDKSFLAILLRKWRRAI